MPAHTLPPKVTDLRGRRFGRLTVLSFAGQPILNSGHRRSTWHCQCDCGMNVVVYADRIKSGKTKSCGCLKRRNRKRLIDLSGKRFGMLTVLSEEETCRKATYWKCQCDCGNSKVIKGSHLKDGRIVSCGCKKNSGDSNRKHGMTRTLVYKVWASAIQRCHNPKTKKYMDYGGRGIRVCDRWRYSFESFYADMGDKPKGMTLERKEVNGDYEPGNCEWATQYVQQNNRRNTIQLTFNGETKTISGWAKSKGVKRTLFANRYRAGWSVERLLTTPVLGPWGHPVGCR